ncbi:LysM peptidoglycan-binding domain-containing M23 family metallopeptidase [uncultured Lentibacter sp.]|uniref:LysM peptidoglycan-binding domain-containing M23 family metallopeptidase n=1 Tax=uncultured Lentibacter sp. TaxID=1659309 RepID=UPI00260A83AD|nr:LysM peptidoglycan-binding domain-containing M23 family metallopeptidase [uncultured Lentibacter sp.]
MTRGFARKMMAASTALALVAGCDTPLDLDLRGKLGSRMDTSSAARAASTERPQTDARGIISYPSYQVAVARSGDTLGSLARRIGSDPEALARYNGIQSGDSLRQGEIIALPERVDAPATALPTTGAGAADVDITELAETALTRVTPEQSRAPTAQNTASAAQIEPIRHKVTRGETAYTVARLYNVSVRALAEWNGLDSDFGIREGQFLLIPTPLAQQPAQAASAAQPSKPGAGTATPLPPSATQPLPQDLPAARPATDPAKSPAQSQPQPQAQTQPQSQAQSQAASTGQLAYPLRGKIIREYAKGKNDGIDIAAAAGSTISAAEAGTVAAITSDADQVPIIVVKHPDNLLTVYANVGDIVVKKGQSVTRGQKLASLRDGEPAFLHFEVRKGFESVDPLPYLQ